MAGGWPEAGDRWEGEGGSVEDDTHVQDHLGGEGQRGRQTGHLAKPLLQVAAWLAIRTWTLFTWTSIAKNTEMCRAVVGTLCIVHYPFIMHSFFHKYYPYFPFLFHFNCFLWRLSKARLKHGTNFKKFNFTVQHQYKTIRYKM